MDLLVTIGVISSAWMVWYDAAKNNIGRTERKSGLLDFNYSPGGWACSVLLLWAVALPLYVFRRKHLIQIGKESGVVGKGKFATSVAVILSAGSLLINGGTYMYRHYGPGFDRQLNTGSVEKFQESYAAAAASFYPQQASQLDWAASNLTIENIMERYPNATPRMIVQGEAKAELKRVEARLNELKQQKAATDSVRNEIGKVRISNVQSVVEAQPYGQTFKLSLDMKNDSRYAYSHLNFKARLYLNDNREPTAETTLTNNFNDINGLNPGQTTSSVYLISNSYDSRAWQTIEVRTAKIRRVEISIEPDSARDLGERLIVNDTVDEEWNNLIGQKALAEQALRIGTEAYESCLFNCGPGK